MEVCSKSFSCCVIIFAEYHRSQDVHKCRVTGRLTKKAEFCFHRLRKKICAAMLLSKGTLLLDLDKNGLIGQKSSL